MTTFDIEKSQVENFEKWKQEHDKQIKAEALSECLNIVRTNGYQVSLIMIKGLLEQLKGVDE